MTPIPSVTDNVWKDYYFSPRQRLREYHGLPDYQKYVLLSRHYGRMQEEKRNLHHQEAEDMLQRRPVLFTTSNRRGDIPVIDGIVLHEGLCKQFAVNF